MYKSSNGNQNNYENEDKFLSAKRKNSPNNNPQFQNEVMLLFNSLKLLLYRKMSNPPMEKEKYLSPIYRITQTKKN